MTNESLSLYYAGSTYNLHKSLFRDVLGRFLIEGMIIALLVLLHIFGYERSHNTELTVYSSKTGRGIVRHKLAAAIGNTARNTYFGFLIVFGVNILCFAIP
jgi:hypothetical protein